MEIQKLERIMYYVACNNMAPDTKPKTHFQSFLIISQSKSAQRAKSKELAKSLKIDLEKVSPDVFFIIPPKAEITIDQIRHLKSHIFQKPLEYDHKIIIIEDAHTATTEAQNSLLKILEEPPQHAVIILEAKNKGILLPTIISRTVVIEAKSQKTKAGTETQQSLLDQNLQGLLEKISQVENPEEFVDTQIIALTQKLVEKVTRNQKPEPEIITAIEKCKEAKEMIIANVNPQFTLANLAFTLKSQS